MCSIFYYIFVSENIMSLNTNILFYSSTCQMCSSLISILKNENMLQYFKCMCVDDIRVRKSIPSTITRVPTVIIPSLNKVFVANDIFKWLQTLKMARIQNSMSSQQIQTHQNNETLPQGKPTPQNPDSRSNPIGFVQHEMSGVSDAYAYTTINEVPRHTYMSCTELDKSTIFTAPEKQSKITQCIQPEFIKDAERKRREQDELIGQLFQTQQKNIDAINAKRNEMNNVICSIVEKQQHNILNEFNTK